MDRNKTIIFIIVIVASVAVFLGVGLWWFYPKNVAAVPANQAIPLQYVQGMNTPAPTDPAIAAGGNGAQPAAGQQPAVNVTNQQVLVVDGAGNPVSPYQIGPDGRLVRTAEAAAAQPSPSPEASPAATPAASPAGGAQVKTDGGLVVSAGTQQGKAEVKVSNQAKPAAAKASPAPAPSAKATEKAPDKPAASKAPAASAKPSPAASPAARKSGKEYWIQVISTTSKDRVEQVRKDLAALGFNGRVMAFTKDGKDFYRLRYGPYTDRAEAGKFLEWVKMIKGMDGSFIAEEKPEAAAKPASAKP